MDGEQLLVGVVEGLEKQMSGRSRIGYPGDDRHFAGIEVDLETVAFSSQEFAQQVQVVGVQVF